MKIQVPVLNVQKCNNVCFVKAKVRVKQKLVEATVIMAQEEEEETEVGPPPLEIPDRARPKNFPP